MKQSRGRKQPAAALAVVLASFAGLSSVRATEPVPAPGGAEWIVAAPRADHFAAEASSFLATAARYSLTLAPRRVNSELVRATGLPLLSMVELHEQGIDETAGWVLFEKQGATFLAVTVREAKAFTEAMEAWRRARMLGHREQGEVSGLRSARWVLYARSEGSRSAAGYAISRDRAVILLGSGVEAAGLQDALRAAVKAAPLKPGASGTLVARLPALSEARDVWLGFRFRADGVEAEATASRVEGRLLSAERRRSSWIRAITHQGEATMPAPLRVRAVAGSGATAVLGELLGRLLPGVPADDQGGRWWKAVGAAAQGPVELLFTGLDLSGRGAGPLQLFTPPTVVLPFRISAQVEALLDAAAEILPGADRGADGTVSSGSGGVTVGHARDAVFVGRMPPVRVAQFAAIAGGTPQFGCPTGVPVASARLEPWLLAEPLRRIGLMQALKDETLMKLYGFNTEYGGLLRGSGSVTALACQDDAGTVRVQARWPLAPPPR